MHGWVPPAVQVVTALAGGDHGSGSFRFDAAAIATLLDALAVTGNGLASGRRARGIQC